MQLKIVSSKYTVIYQCYTNVCPEIVCMFIFFYCTVSYWKTQIQVMHIHKIYEINEINYIFFHELRETQTGDCTL